MFFLPQKNVEYYQHQEESSHTKCEYHPQITANHTLFNATTKGVFRDFNKLIDSIV